MKKIWVKKNFMLKKILCLKYSQSKILDLGSKKTGRVNPGGRIYDPPQKILGLKLCWIFVSFAR